MSCTSRSDLAEGLSNLGVRARSERWSRRNRPHQTTERAVSAPPGTSDIGMTTASPLTIGPEVQPPPQRSATSGRPRTLGALGPVLATLLTLAAMMVASDHPNPPYPALPLSPIICQATEDPLVRRPPLLLSVIDDRSSSTWSSDVAPPRREAELRAVVEHLAETTCTDNDLIAAMSFDDVVLPAGPVPTTSAPALQSVLDALPDASKEKESSSTAGPMLDRATQWAREHPGHLSVALMATDGLVADEAETAKAVRQFPGRVVVVALGRQLPAFWAELQVEVVLLDRGQLQLGDVAVNTVTALNGVLLEEVEQ